MSFAFTVVIIDGDDDHGDDDRDVGAVAGHVGTDGDPGTGVGATTCTQRQRHDRLSPLVLPLSNSTQSF